MAKVMVKITAHATVELDSGDLTGYDIDQVQEFLDDDINDASPEELAEAMVRADADNDALPLDELDWDIDKVDAVRVVAVSKNEEEQLALFDLPTPTGVKQ
jgi:hypothetical protein